MGVDRSDYILIGANLGDMEFTDEQYDDFYEKGYTSSRKHQEGEIAYLDDCYGGNYFIVGEIIEVDKDGYNGLSLNEFDLLGNVEESPFLESKQRVQDHIRENFGLNVQAKLIVLTHLT